MKGESRNSLFVNCTKFDGPLGEVCGKTTETEERMSGTDDGDEEMKRLLILYV